MTDQKPTIASLKREIERLNARLVVSEDARDRQWTVLRNNIYESVDAEMRIKQAITILSGNDQ